MISISAIICTHNPRPDYLRRVLDALKAQTLPKDQWELLLIDNASKEPLARSWDLSWHPHARHIREDELGLTPARLRGIAEAEGDLLVFVDDDNVPAPAYLERAAAVPASNSHITVFGAGTLEPEFEEEPAEIIRPWLGMLGIRVVSRPTWTNNVADYFCTPWGAGLCVPRRIAMLYCQIVRELLTSQVLDRHGENLFCGGDDLFSWLSVRSDAGYGIFPELRITHLISAGRVRQDYIVRLVREHTFSHAGTPLHGLRYKPMFGAGSSRFAHHRSWTRKRPALHALPMGGVTRNPRRNSVHLGAATSATVHTQKPIKRRGRIPD